MKTHKRWWSWAVMVAGLAFMLQAPLRIKAQDAPVAQDAQGQQDAQTQDEQKMQRIRTRIPRAAWHA